MVPNLLVYGNDDRIAAQNKIVKHQDKFQVSIEISLYSDVLMYSNALQLPIQFVFYFVFSEFLFYTYVVDELDILHHLTFLANYCC